MKINSDCLTWLSGNLNNHIHFEKLEKIGTLIFKEKYSFNEKCSYGVFSGRGYNIRKRG